MFIDTNSLIVNGLNLGPFILEAKYSYNKLWSEDSGRNLAGTQTGTLIGIFPKIVVQFRKLSQLELEQIAPILDSPTQNLTYYDPVKKTNITMSTYTGDWELVNRGILQNQGFSCSFIARSKRG